MPDKIYIGNFSGLKLNVKPFNIDNETFSTLFNAYAWRGQIKRKRGTSPLARLEQQIKMVASVTLPWEYAELTLSSGAANLITGNSLESGSSITPGSITLVVGSNTYSEPNVPDGTLVGVPSGSGTI